MKKLYHYCMDCGRMGEVEGLFVAESEDVDKAVGEEVYFGEIFGKHSDIAGTLDQDELIVKSEDQEFILKLLDVMGSETISGHNPLNYLRDED